MKYLRLHILTFRLSPLPRDPDMAAPQVPLAMLAANCFHQSPMAHDPRWAEYPGRGLFKSVTFEITGLKCILCAKCNRRVRNGAELPATGTVCGDIDYETGEVCDSDEFRVGTYDIEDTHDSEYLDLWRRLTSSRPRGYAQLVGQPAEATSDPKPDE